jgi:hypothetical protein
MSGGFRESHKDISVQDTYLGNARREEFVALLRHKPQQLSHYLHHSKVWLLQRGGLQQQLAMRGRVDELALCLASLGLNPANKQVLGYCWESLLP